MEVFRIARDKYAQTLIASGKAARWNKDNQFVLYAAQSRSLAALELTVHKSGIKTILPYKTMIISLAEDEKLYTRKVIRDMPLNWRKLVAYPALQAIGNDWYINNTSLILQVPSVIIPQEFNYIVNLQHPDFSEKTVSLVRTEDYYWDNRLLT
jgi:RES domain-containing protein